MYLYAAGVLRPHQTVDVLLEYDPTQVAGQGRFDTNILVTMSEQPYAKASPLSALKTSVCRACQSKYVGAMLIGSRVCQQAYAATLLLFCAELSTVRQSQLPQTFDVNITRLQDGPSPPPSDPTATLDWTIAASADCATCAFVEATIR